MKNEIEARLSEILKTANGLERSQKLSSLRDTHPHEALDALIHLMHSSDQALRRRAGTSLSWFREIAATKATALAEMLQHHEDERIRLLCAIHLMPVPGPAVDQGFLAALRDPFDTIVQIACLEVGARAGTPAVVALTGLLEHPSWRVRLEACKALITFKKADARVVATLEAMGHEPEAAVYDAECDNQGLDMVTLLEFGEALGILPESEKDGMATKPQPESWGKFQTILARARRIAHNNNGAAEDDCLKTRHTQSDSV